MPSRRLAGSPGLHIIDVLCPSCSGDDLANAGSLRTTSEAMPGTVASEVVIDLMSCKNCGAEIPTVRGERRYVLVPKRRLSDLLTDLEETRQIRVKALERLEGMRRRSERLAVEVKRLQAKRDLEMKGRVAALESALNALEGRQSRPGKR